MNLSDQEIDALVREALDAELAHVHANDDLLHRIRERVTPSRAPVRRVRWAVAAVVVVVTGGIGAAAVLAPPTDDAVTVGSGGGGTVLSVPPVGEAAAEALADGTPVWVVHHQNGEVSVLDAASTHEPFGVPHLVGWCEPSRGFQDGQHGSVFDEQGNKRGGPAPRHLDRYEAVRADDSGVITVGPLVEGERVGPPAPVTTPKPDRSVGCSATGLQTWEYNPGTTVRHQFNLTDARSMTAVDGAPNDQMVLFSGTVVLREGQPTVVCDGRQPLLSECEGPEAPGVSLPPGGAQRATLFGPFLARASGGTLQDVTFVDGYMYQFSRAEDPTADRWCDATASALPYSAETLTVELLTAAEAAELHHKQEPDEVEPWSARPAADPVALCTFTLSSPPEATDAGSERFADAVVQVLTDGTASTTLPN